jgi:hypothetical protein
MIFGKFRGRVDLGEKAIRMAHENAVNSIYKYERKTLAIAKMSYYQSFNSIVTFLGNNADALRLGMGHGPLLATGRIRLPTRRRHFT